MIRFYRVPKMNASYISLKEASFQQQGMGHFPNRARLIADL